MIIAGIPEHETLVTHSASRRPIWYCQHADWLVDGLADGYEVHYRRSCPRCFVGFMDNARTKNLFNVNGVNKAVYNMGEARLWFFRLYKGDTNEGE